MTNLNWLTVTNTDGTWQAPGRWAGVAYIDGRVIATGLPVAVGTADFGGLAEFLIRALAQHPGMWTEDCTIQFVHAGEIVVGITIHAATRTVDGEWLRDGQWFGVQGVDVSGVLAKSDGAVRV